MKRPMGPPPSVVVIAIRHRTAAGRTLDRRAVAERRVRPAENTGESLAHRRRDAIIYARVSSKDQEKGGYSIPAQLKLLRAYAQDNDLAALAESVTLARGGVFTLWLVAAYGLASWILMARARTLAPDRPEQSDLRAFRLRRNARIRGSGNGNRVWLFDESAG